MKKLLLSSVIMFGVCSFVSAQSAKETKKPFTPAPANAVAATPTLTAAPAAVASPANDVVDSKQAATTTVAPVTTKPARVSKTTEAKPQALKTSRVAPSKN
ncbi:MAG: hypothetical protein ABI685_07695 [Ferruginibacter sp.]